MGNLDGKKVLITGSGGGMGRSHAVLMAERGADIIVHDIKREGAVETAELVRGMGRKAHVITVDVRDVRSLQRDVATGITALGGIDVLVNNAGVGGKRRAIEDIDEAIFDEMFDIQVKGAFFATQAVVPAMKAQRSGRIINISSIYAMGGNVNASHYAAAKSALSGFTKSWARELAPFKINVNAVAPGFIVTEMTLGSNPVEKVRERETRMPLGRFVEPIEISYAVAWLASPETEMITGQVISPNSGETIVGY
jgi:3-oxoacyl-[acyl-carrier protein] reductase